MVSHYTARNWSLMTFPKKTKSSPMQIAVNWQKFSLDLIQGDKRGATGEELVN